MRKPVLDALRDEFRKPENNYLCKNILKEGLSLLVNSPCGLYTVSVIKIYNYL